MIDISFRPVYYGWLEAEVAGDNVSSTIRASYILSDALSNFISALTVLLEGVSDTQCVWQEEPGEYHWHFTRRGGEVDVKVIWYEQPVNRSSREGEIVFSGTEDILRLARKVKRLYTLLDTESYSRTWGHDYPCDLVQRLGKALKK